MIPYKNGSNFFGGIVSGTIRRGVRCSSAKAFLRPVRERSNLHIAMNSHVHRILIDSKNRAYGVLLQRKDKMYAIVARKEVVLSAGAIGSPQILMLSGIGPADHLKSLGSLFFIILLIASVWLRSTGAIISSLWLSSNLKQKETKQLWLKSAINLPRLILADCIKFVNIRRWKLVSLSYIFCFSNGINKVIPIANYLLEFRFEFLPLSLVWLVKLQSRKTKRS